MGVSLCLEQKYLIASFRKTIFQQLTFISCHRLAFTIANCLYCPLYRAFLPVLGIMAFECWITFFPIRTSSIYKGAMNYAPKEASCVGCAAPYASSSPWLLGWDSQHEAVCAEVATSCVARGFLQINLKQVNFLARSGWNASLGNEANHIHCACIVSSLPYTIHYLDQQETKVNLVLLPTRTECQLHTDLCPSYLTVGDDCLRISQHCLQWFAQGWSICLACDLAPIGQDRHYIQNRMHKFSSSDSHAVYVSVWLIMQT